LSIAVGQYQLLNSEDASGVKPDSFKVEPLLMSHLDPTQVDALINGKVVNPKTNKPYAKEDFSSSSSPEADKAGSQNLLIMSAMQNQMQLDRRKGYRGRIDNLVATGRTTKAFADAQLYPQADSYNIEFKDNQIVTPVVETLLMSLESMPAPSQPETSGLTMGSLDDSNVDQKEIDDMAKYMASLV